MSSREHMCVFICVCAFAGLFLFIDICVHFIYFCRVFFLIELCVHVIYFHWGFLFIELCVRLLVPTHRSLIYSKIHACSIVCVHHMYVVISDQTELCSSTLPCLRLRLSARVSVYVLQRVAVCGSVFQCVAVCCSVLHCPSVCACVCMLVCQFVYQSLSACLATHCNTLQHTATHCNTLQHTWIAFDWVSFPTAADASCPCTFFFKHGTLSRSVSTQCMLSQCLLPSFAVTVTLNWCQFNVSAINSMYPQKTSIQCIRKSVSIQCIRKRAPYIRKGALYVHKSLRALCHHNRQRHQRTPLLNKEPYCGRVLLQLW